MAKEQFNESDSQLKKKRASKKVSKIKNSKIAEIEKTFAKHTGPREVIEHVKHKLYPIESGKIRFFNQAKGEGFIIPNDGSNDVYVQDSERSFKSGDDVSYININHQAFIANKGLIKSKLTTDDIKTLFITPNNGNDDVSLVLDPLSEHTIDFDAFNNEDEVEFIANKKGIVVALHKKQ